MALFFSHFCHQLYIIPSPSSFYGHSKLYNQAPIVQSRILQSCLILLSSSSMPAIFVLFLIHSFLSHWDPHWRLSDYIILLPILLTFCLASSNYILPILTRIILKMKQPKKKTHKKHQTSKQHMNLIMPLYC